MVQYFFLKWGIYGKLLIKQIRIPLLVSNNNHSRVASQLFYAIKLVEWLWRSTTIKQIWVYNPGNKQAWICLDNFQFDLFISSQRLPSTILQVKSSLYMVSIQADQSPLQSTQFFVLRHCIPSTMSIQSDTSSLLGIGDSAVLTNQTRSNLMVFNITCWFREPMDLQNYGSNFQTPWLHMISG